MAQKFLSKKIIYLFNNNQKFWLIIMRSQSNKKKESKQSLNEVQKLGEDENVVCVG
ncbi:unnamed protein product [Paramecium primaurelia]|uniref:Uncharacterized protein n=1 Tax=Paramecium primaurelia TaxID=5886 RepID=A0A8S1LX77_PARPR|nr:unnamed protein product [Paramecium primaurelia]